VKSGDSLNIDESNGSADDFMGDENGNTDVKTSQKSQDSGKNKPKSQTPKATTSSSQSDYRKKK
jgi:hypothetical protein